MASISFKAFRGAVPRTGQRLQQPRYAGSARNIKITNGEVVPLRGMKLTHDSLADSIKSMWRYRHTLNGAVQECWLTFADDTNVVGSMIADEAMGRVYWTSESHEPRMSFWTAAVVASGPYPVNAYQLGIPLPKAAASVSATGGVAANVTRSYTYTFVNDLGEESGPAPASALVTNKSDATWTLTGMDAAPANSGAVTGRTNVAGNIVRLNVASAKWIAVGTRILISGVAQMAVFGLGRDLNGLHKVLAVDGVANTIDISLPPQNGITIAGTWALEYPFYTSGLMMRIYHTSGTAAQFLFLAEITPAASYAHTTPASGEPIPTLNSLPPPPKLKCLIAMPNGCLCGINENEVCFSEPYLPYSWPIANRYSFVGKGVAVGSSGNSAIVLTEGFPIMLTGSDPEAMSMTTMETYAPCVSKRGAVNVGGGILYPSHDGLWLATAAGAVINTRSLFRMDEWKALAPETFEAEFHDGQYYAVHTPVGGKKQMLVLDIVELDSVVTVDDSADALARNDYDGALYTAKGGNIYKFDASDDARYFSEWTSVEVQIDQPRNFSHAQVHADWRQVVPLDTSVYDANVALIAAGADAVNGYILGSEFNTFEINGSNLRRYEPGTERRVQFVLLDEAGPIYSKTVTSSRPFRLPSGFKQEVARVGLNTSITVYSARIAESSPELSGEP